MPGVPLHWGKGLLETIKRVLLLGGKIRGFWVVAVRAEARPGGVQHLVRAEPAVQQHLPQAQGAPGQAHERAGAHRGQDGGPAQAQPL